MENEFGVNEGKRAKLTGPMWETTSYEGRLLYVGLVFNHTQEEADALYQS